MRKNARASPNAAPPVPAPTRPERLPLAHEVADSVIAVMMDRQCLALDVQARCGRVRLTKKEQEQLVTRKRMREKHNRNRSWPFTQTSARRAVAYDVLVERLDCRVCEARDRCRRRRS